MSPAQGSSVGVVGKSSESRPRSRAMTTDAAIPLLRNWLRRPCSASAVAEAELRRARKRLEGWTATPVSSAADRSRAVSQAEPHRARLHRSRRVGTSGNTFACHKCVAETTLEEPPRRGRSWRRDALPSRHPPGRDGGNAWAACLRTHPHLSWFVLVRRGCGASRAHPRGGARLRGYSAARRRPSSRRSGSTSSRSCPLTSLARISLQSCSTRLAMPGCRGPRRDELDVDGVVQALEPDRRKEARIARVEGRRTCVESPDAGGSLAVMGSGATHRQERCHIAPVASSLLNGS